MARLTNKVFRVEGAKRLKDFEVKPRVKVFGQDFENARLLKEILIYFSLVCEKNDISGNPPLVLVLKNGRLLKYKKTTSLSPFKGLNIPDGAFVALNCGVNKSQIEYVLSERLRISGLVCPGIEEDAIEYLMKLNPRCLIYADPVVSQKREDSLKLMDLPGQVYVPKFFNNEDESFLDLAISRTLKNIPKV